MAASIPAHVAAYTFTQETGADQIAAYAYLPVAFEHCAKCDSMESHAHPAKPFMTSEEVAEAVREYLRDQYELAHDA